MTRGAFNFAASGQEYLFSYSASSGQDTGTSGCCAVPLRVTSLGAQNGLYPAVVLSYDVANDRFVDTVESCWAITTNLNLLQLSKYTGIKVGESGGKDIFCISENLTISDSLGLQALTGVNQLEFDTPHNWLIRAGAQPGQAIAERLFRVQDERGQPPVDHVDTETFLPYYTWDIGKGNPSGLEARIRRRFEVYLDGAIVQQDVYLENFIPACTCSVSQAGAGAVSIRRLFRVQTNDPSAGAFAKDDVALIQFQPFGTWTLGAAP